MTRSGTGCYSQVLWPLSTSTCNDKTLWCYRSRRLRGGMQRGVRFWSVYVWSKEWDLDWFMRRQGIHSLFGHKSNVHVGRGRPNTSVIIHAVNTARNHQGARRREGARHVGRDGGMPWSNVDVGVQDPALGFAVIHAFGKRPPLAVDCDRAHVRVAPCF